MLPHCPLCHKPTTLCRGHGWKKTLLMLLVAASVPGCWWVFALLVRLILKGV